MKCTNLGDNQIQKIILPDKEDQGNEKQANTHIKDVPMCTFPYVDCTCIQSMCKCVDVIYKPGNLGIRPNVQLYMGRECHAD